MEFIKVNADLNLDEIVRVLNESHGTVAQEFSFTKENNPKNNAFIDTQTLKYQLDNGIELFALLVNQKYIGCVAIEKSKRSIETYYI